MDHSKKERSIHHCMVVHSYYPFGETRVKREAEALIDSDHQVDVICLRYNDEPKFDTSEGVTIYRLPVRRHKQYGILIQLFEYLVFFILAFLKLTVLHFKDRYHTVQVHNLPDFLVFTALVPKLTGCCIILDLHDLMPEFYSAKFNSSMNSFIVRLISWQERLSARFANHVITVSEHWRQDLIKRGVPPDKCSVVMNLADPNIFRPLPNQKDNPGKEKRFCLFYHGTLPKRYGLDLALQAVDKVRYQIPEIQLTIIGNGEYLETLKSIADDLNLRDKHVQFKPAIPVEQLPPLIAAADVGVVPYRDDVFTDSLLPTKLMEYAVMGLPSIVARTSAISIYFDETTVQYFTPDDVEDLVRCIQLLYHNQSRLNELTRNIQKFNQQYNWESHRIEYVKLIEKLATR